MLTTLHREAETQDESSTVASSMVQEALDSRGEPLDQATRSFMEPRFGHDFSKVRVHRDETVKAARAVSALAYTVGQDIVFGAGQYSPQSSEGKKVLAHELAHTIQQGSSVQRLPDRLETTSPSDRAEQEADAAAESVLQGKSLSASEGNDTHEGKEDPGAAPAEETSPTEEATAETEIEGKDTPKKTVTVNVTYLKGGSTDISTHLTKANTVFAQANVDVKKGKRRRSDQKHSQRPSSGMI